MGVRGSVKLQLSAHPGAASIPRILGVGRADTFQTLFTCQRQGGPKLLPDSSWLRVQRTKTGLRIASGQATITDCCVEIKLAGLNRDR